MREKGNLKCGLPFQLKEQQLKLGQYTGIGLFIGALILVITLITLDIIFKK